MQEVGKRRKLRPEEKLQIYKEAVAARGMGRRLKFVCFVVKLGGRGGVRGGCNIPPLLLGLARIEAEGNAQFSQEVTGYLLGLLSLLFHLSNQFTHGLIVNLTIQPVYQSSQRREFFQGVLTHHWGCI